MAEITRNLVGLAHVRKSLGSTAANVTEKTLQVSACVREFPDGQKNCTCEVAGWDGRIRNLWVQFGMWFWRDLDMHKGFCDSGLEGRHIQCRGRKAPERADHNDQSPGWGDTPQSAMICVAASGA